MPGLHVELRPTSFDEMVGNEGTIESLKNILSRDRKKIPHSFLFTGPPGCGKTSLARILAKELGASEWDIIEQDIGQIRSLDSIREIRRKVSLSPMKGDVRVYILDEVHLLLSDSQNALLKILEEPPSHVYFMLCTTDPDKLINTIKSRCSVYTVSSLNRQKMMILLKRVCQLLNLELGREVLGSIVASSEGSPRKALVFLDQVRGMNSEKALEVIKNLTSKNMSVIDLCRAINSRDSVAVADILSKIDEDPEKVRRAVLGYFGKVLLGKMEKKRDFSWELFVLEAFADDYFSLGKQGLILSCGRLFHSRKR